MSPIFLPSRRPTNWSVTFAILFVSVVCGPVRATAQPREAHDKVLNYLDQRGWQRIAILHLSSRLTTELDSSTREQLAAELADRYQRFFFSQSDEVVVNEFIERASRLSLTYPAINSPAFRLAITHAKYIQAEHQFRTWWRASAPAEDIDTIFEQFRSLERQIAAQLRSDEDRQQQLISQPAVDAAAQLEQQRRVDQIELRLLHGHYLFAWTNYFLAILSADISKPLLSQSQASFYRALRIEQPGPIEKIDAKWLDFSPAISQRALIGLGWTYAAMNQDNSARFCFEKAFESTQTVDRSIVEFDALAFARRWDVAADYAKSKEAEQLQQSRFWQTVTHAGYSGIGESADQDRLRQLGLLGLARAFDLENLRKFAVTKDTNLPEDSYLKVWIEALVQFHISRSGDPGRAVALDLLNQLIATNENSIPANDLARLQYLAARIQYEQGEFENSFQRLVGIDRSSIGNAEPFAEQLDWLQVLVSLKRAAINTLYQTQALTALNQFIDLHPDSKRYHRALSLRFKLSIELLPAGQALNKLSAVPNDHPFFVDVQLEIVKCLRRCWLESANNPSAQDRFFRQLVDADRQLQTMPEIKTNQKLKSVLTVADIAIRSRKAPAITESLLDQADTILSNFPEDDDRQHHVDYLRFLDMKQRSRWQTAAEWAQTLAVKSPTKNHRVAALAFVAELHDRKADLPLQLDQLTTYQLLVDEMGTSIEKLRSSKNARVAASRLVELYVASGQFGERAKAINDNLLELAPNQRRYLLAQARIAMGAGDTQSAIKVWRKILQSTVAGDDVWFESKLGIIKCLIGSNPADAAKVLRQTINLAGEIPVQWQLQFDEVTQVLIQPDQNQ